MNYNNFKEKLPTFFPWGMLFLLSVSLIVLPALSCRKEKTQQAQTSKPGKLGRRGKWFSKKQRSVKSKKAPPATTTEWSILN